MKLIVCKYNELKSFIKINNISDKTADNILREGLFNFIHTNIELFAEFNCKSNSGVYFINDFYIGRSNNFRKRITYHILELFNIDGQKSNMEKLSRIQDILNSNQKLNITILSEKQEDEELLIKKYTEKYDLTNIEFNYKRKNHRGEIYIRRKDRISGDDIINKIIKSKTLLDIDNILKDAEQFEIIEKGEPRTYMVLVIGKKKKYHISVQKDIFCIFNTILEKNVSKLFIDDLIKYKLSDFSVYVEIINDDVDIKPKQIKYLNNNGFSMYALYNKRNKLGEITAKNYLTRLKFRK